MNPSTVGRMVLAIVAAWPAVARPECIRIWTGDPVQHLKASEAVYVARVTSVDKHRYRVKVLRSWKGKAKEYTWTGAPVEVGAAYLVYTDQRGAEHFFEAECGHRPIPVSEGARDITLLNRYRGYQRLVVPDAPPNPR